MENNLQTMSEAVNAGLERVGCSTDKFAEAMNDAQKVIENEGWEPGEWTQDIKTINVGEIDSHCSGYGNTFSTITREQLTALCHGKILYLDDGEYGHFIALEKKKG